MPAVWASFGLAVLSLMFVYATELSKASDPNSFLASASASTQTTTNVCPDQNDDSLAQATASCRMQRYFFGAYYFCIPKSQGTPPPDYSLNKYYYCKDPKGINLSLSCSSHFDSNNFLVWDATAHATDDSGNDDIDVPVIFKWQDGQNHDDFTNNSGQASNSDSASGVTSWVHVYADVPAPNNVWEEATCTASASSTSDVVWESSDNNDNTKTITGDDELKDTKPNPSKEIGDPFNGPLDFNL